MSIGKFVLKTALTGAVVCATVWTVPPLRVHAQKYIDQFRQAFSERENEIIAALGPSDEQVAASAKHRADKKDTQHDSEDDLELF